MGKIDHLIYLDRIHSNLIEFIQKTCLALLKFFKTSKNYLTQESLKIKLVHKF